MDFSFDDAVLGLGLPVQAEAALKEAGANRGDAPRAMAALMRAQSLAPDHPAVLIALYRHHFYGHRIGPARDVARRALLAGAQALGLPESWRGTSRQALAGAKDDPSVRFYLFTLKGYAYLSMRLDDPVEARDALQLLRHLDPDDCVGGALIEAVRLRALAGEQDLVYEESAPPPVFGAAAWARLAPA
jgi:hypothetical protein